MKQVNFFFGVMHVRYWFCFFCILFCTLDNYYKELEYVRVHVVLTKTVVDSNLRFSVC